MQMHVTRGFWCRRSFKENYSAKVLAKENIIHLQYFFAAVFTESASCCTFSPLCANLATILKFKKLEKLKS